MYVMVTEEGARYRWEDGFPLIFNSPEEVKQRAKAEQLTNWKPQDITGHEFLSVSEEQWKSGMSRYRCDWCGRHYDDHIIT